MKSRVALICLVLAFALIMTQTVDAAIAFNEFAVPTAVAAPFRIHNGPDGNLYFTEQTGNKIGKITPAGSITEYPIPTAASSPAGIRTGPDGNVWFTELAGNKIGMMTQSGAFIEYPVPTAAASPHGIHVGIDGNIWFTEQAGNKIGKITTAGVITEYPVPTAASVPSGIVPGLDGNLYFTEQAGNKIGRITMAGTITEFLVPTAASSPGSIAIGPDGNLWFTEEAASKIGMMTTTGVFTEFALPLPAATPNLIATGADGNLYFTIQGIGGTGGNKIGQITTAGTITELSIPTANSKPAGITSGPDGNIWFTEQNANNIGQIVFTPAQGGRISGTVTNPNKAGVQGIAVSAYLGESKRGTRFTDANGNYTLSGLIAGNYKIQFYGSVSGYANQWFNSKADWTSADVVTVTPPNVTAGISAAIAAQKLNVSIAVFRNGTWFIDNNQNGLWDAGADAIIPFGIGSDIPVMGDWNGSGTKKIGVFRNGWWYLDYPGTGNWVGCGAPNDPAKDACISYGAAGDIPVVGDWTGTGTTKIGVFRNGVFYLNNQGTGAWIGCGTNGDPTKDACLNYGMAGDIPVVGDWTGNGKIKIGIFRNGIWYLNNPGTGNWTGCGINGDSAMDACIGFGMAGDIPVVADWNGNGKTKIGVFRNGYWYLEMVGNGAWDSVVDVSAPFGIFGDKPIVK